MLVIGKIYSFEIIRERVQSESEGQSGTDNTVTSDDVKLTQIDKIEGTLSNILADPDNTPRYIFTNVLITNSEGQFRGEMHSVPENMVSNVQEL
jgi:hypothetical protein